MRLLIIFVVLLLLSSCQKQTDEPTTPKIPIKVVLVSMFEAGESSGDRPGEFQYWVERLPLSETVDFPAGTRDLQYNAELGVLGVVTGIGNTQAAITITALGLDERFDLSNAYWLVAGISGVDPEDASTGSAVWAEWLVDGDLSHEIDPREAPEEWKTGYIPLRMTQPYEQPLPERIKTDMVVRLQPSLVDWAYNLTKDIELDDNKEIQNMREQYSNFPNAQTPPRVLKGDQLAASTYWHGELLNTWANDWVKYWTEGEGNFVTSAMEEMGTYQSLMRLEKLGKVDKERLLVLRTASNFTMQWTGVSAYESLAGEKLSGKGYSAYIPSLEAAYRVGQPVIMELVENWGTYEDTLPN
jgi:purine nucleoside permease